MPWSSNGAADFVQLHGQDALGTEVVLVEGETTYDTGVDKFRPTSEIVEYVCPEQHVTQRAVDNNMAVVC